MKKTGFFTTHDYESSDDDAVEERILRRQKKQENLPDDPETRARLERLKPYNSKLRRITRTLINNDYTAILSDFQALMTDLDRDSEIMHKDGYPPLLFKTLLKIDSQSNALTSKDKTRMSKETKSSMTKLRQKVKKVMDELSDELEAYKKNPLTSDQSDDDETETEEEEYEEVSAEEAVQESEKESKSEDEDDGDDQTSEWDDNSDENEANAPVVNDENMSRQERRKKWLKDPETIKREQVEKDKKRRQYERRERNYQILDLNQDFQKIDMSDKSIHRRLRDLANSRNEMGGGKLPRNISMLEYILDKTESKQRRLEIIILLLNLKNELNRSEGQHLTTQSWQDMLDIIQEYLEILTEGNNFLDNTVRSYLKEEEETYQKSELESLFISSLATLDNDWLTLIKLMDPDSVSYATVLREEIRLIRLLKNTLLHLLKGASEANVAFIAHRLLEHIYYFSNNSLVELQRLVPDYPIKANEKGFVQKLTSLIYNKVAEQSISVKASLFEAYNYAINDRYNEAKDLLLMHNLGEKSSQSETSLSYHFNRALTALGLCAFRLGKVEESQDILDEICSSGRLKELLNQTNFKGYLEREDKKNLMPYHMSISVENIESAYFISVMLNEAPILGSQLSNNEKKSSNSKLFQKLWQFYEKNPLCGPPENHRDLIYAAVKEMLNGEWRNCYNLICQLNIWEKFENVTEIKQKYLRLIKKCAFKTLIFSIKNNTHVLKFERLAELFELHQSDLLKITAESIYSGELECRIDPSTNSLLTGRKELGEIDSQTERLNQRIHQCMNLNEKLFDSRFADVSFSEIFTSNDLGRNSRKAKSTIRLLAN